MKFGDETQAFKRRRLDAGYQVTQAAVLETSYYESPCAAHPSRSVSTPPVRSLARSMPMIAPPTEVTSRSPFIGTLPRANSTDPLITWEGCAVLNTQFK